MPVATIDVRGYCQGWLKNTAAGEMYRLSSQFE
jgi:hypothetical protein